MTIGSAMPFFSPIAAQNYQSEAAAQLVSNSLYHHQRLPMAVNPVTNLSLVGMAAAATSATRKGGQIRFTNWQSNQLEEKFLTTKYLTPAQRRALANRLNLTERQVCRASHTHDKHR